MPDEPIPTPPDDTRHGPVPPTQPDPVKPDPGRKPLPPYPEKVGDNPVRPPGHDPFPDGSELEDDDPRDNLG